MVALFRIVFFLSAGNAADWPGFRGPQFGQSPEKDLPSCLTENNGTRRDGLFVADGKEFKRIARLTFPEKDGVVNGTTAVSDGRLYVRSNAYLYCIGKTGTE